MPCPFILRSAPVEQYKEDIAASVAQVFEGIDGTVESRPGRGDRRRAGRVPPRGCELDAEGRAHPHALFQLYDGTTATSLPVQWIPEVAEEVGQGCEQIQSTFSLE
jgi:hypothetical protein